MRFFIFSLFVSVLITGCRDKNATSSDLLTARNGVVIKYVTASRANVKTFLPNLCDTFAIEVKGLYAVLDTLPDATFDSVFLDNLLLENGFVVKNAGRGNWQHGPRFITLELQRDSCFCSVYKKYYASAKSDSLHITERLVCNTNVITGVEK